MSPLAEKIDALLPQTQCTRCGYAGCLPYAEAIAAGSADIDQCPPGGAAGIAKLAALLERPEKGLNPANGVDKPLEVAVIDEHQCIGCTLCIAACPVDVIVGAAKLMHTVIASACTGCELCIAPCPVDCIHMQPVEPARAWNAADAALARSRFQERNARIAAGRSAQEHKLAAQSTIGPQTTGDGSAVAEARKQAIIAAALARARKTGAHA